MELIAQVNEREHEINIRQLEPDLYEVTLAGQTFTVHCREPIKNLYSLLIEEDSYEVRVSDRDKHDRMTAVLRENSYSIETLNPMERVLGESGGRQVKGDVVIESVMPGKVLRLLVSPGDEVEEGQAVLVLVAMKMENEIEAPKSGVIKSIDVSEGDPVESGAPLMVIA